jgi:hypothetical protein
MNVSSASPTALSLPLAQASYLATSTWETYAAGDYQATTTTRTLRVHLQPGAQGHVLTIAAGRPVVRAATDPPPLVELAQRLAALYAHLELLVTPAGEVAALLNYEALRQAGERLLSKLQAAAEPGDQLTATLLAFAGRQLAAPAALLHSLQFDYLYQTLGLGVAQALPGQTPVARQFAGFFDKTPLWFAEQARLEPVTEAGHFALRLQGALDAQRTDLAAVQAHQAKALQLVAPSKVPATLPPPHFCYEATYSLGPAPGLPQYADLTVYARAGQLLNKEYHLTIERV